jgi:ribosomal protein S18 acetylase RimI-like enzyme
MLHGVTDRLRPARVGDLPTIWLGERAYMREIEPEREARWTAATDRNLAFWIAGLERTRVLESDGAPAGYEAWAQRDGVAVLTTIHVFDGYRRAGRGALLLRAFVDDARAQGFAELTLGVHRDNSARRLYERHGFVHGHDEGDYCHYTLPGEGARPSLEQADPKV